MNAVLAVKLVGVLLHFVLEALNIPTSLERAWSGLSGEELGVCRCVDSLVVRSGNNDEGRRNSRRRHEN